jgi:hypothetical protein
MARRNGSDLLAFGSAPTVSEAIGRKLGAVARTLRPITARGTVIQFTSCAPGKWDVQMIKHRGFFIANIAVRASPKCGSSFCFGLGAMKFPKRIAMPTMPTELPIGLAV